METNILKFVQDNPNDFELGSKIRKLYNSTGCNLPSETMNELVRTYSNDFELGTQVRDLLYDVIELSGLL